jgi:F0F1-type ATP synthase membrane subunit b/b'
MQETLSFIKYLATSNAINFALMLGILYWIIKKINLDNIFNIGINKIENEIKISEEKVNNSKKNLNQAEALLDGLEQDIKNLDNNCKEKIKVFEKQINENTSKSISDINESIDKILLIDEKKLSNLMIEEAANNSINQAKENIINLIKSNPDIHNKFIINSIEELDKVKL